MYYYNCTYTKYYNHIEIQLDVFVFFMCIEIMTVQEYEESYINNINIIYKKNIIYIKNYTIFF